MKNIILKFALIASSLLFLLFACTKQESEAGIVRLQLNWLHDPTFTGEYFLSQSKDVSVRIKEGGPNVFPISELLNNRADVAIIGADIFLKNISNSIDNNESNQLLCFFIDFQRNPVGWILHPEVATELGLDTSLHSSQKQLNSWLFLNLNSSKLEIGDKRGTETTSILLKWKTLHNLDKNIEIVPVGFDASIIMAKPPLAYPVYLNEEPYNLSAKIKKDVIVFDPSADGVNLYGNVLVTTKKFYSENKELITMFSHSLQRSWDFARLNLQTAVKLVSQYYTGIPDSVIQQQIQKTFDFVYFGDVRAGDMDLTSNGRWFQTIEALKNADIISKKLTLELIKDHLVTN